MSSTGKTGGAGTAIAVLVLIVLILAGLGLSAYVWMVGAMTLLGVSFAGALGLYVLVLIVAYVLTTVLRAAAETL